MFDMGFIADLRFILRRLPPPERRQSFLFSATLSFRVLELTWEFMNNPSQITIMPRQKTAERVEQTLYHVGREEKFPLLLGLMRREGDRFLIFSNTREEAPVEWAEDDLSVPEIKPSAEERRRFAEERRARFEARRGFDRGGRHGGGGRDRGRSGPATHHAPHQPPVQPAGGARDGASASDGGPPRRRRRRGRGGGGPRPEGGNA